MFIPKNMTESEVLVEINKVVDKLAPTYAFGYYDLEDIKQEAIIEAIKVLPLYDPIDKNGDATRPLANFLFVHVKRRLNNLKRNKYRRTDAPCSLCHNNRHHEHEDGKVCKKYLSWRKTNNRKANLTQPLTLDGINEDGESNIEMEDTVARDTEANELKRIIDRELDPTIRNDYLRLLAKEKLPKTRKQKVEDAIKLIMDKYYGE